MQHLPLDGVNVPLHEYCGRSRTRRLGWAGAAAIVVALTAATSAQPGGARASLASATKVSCEFSLYARGGWKEDEPEADVKRTSLKFRFEDVDSDGGTAKAVGPFGASDIIVRVTPTALHFVQSFRDGPLYITTVIAKQTKSGRWLAVHTRHEYADIDLPGFTSKPEQYYGSCTLER